MGAAPAITSAAPLAQSSGAVAPILLWIGALIAAVVVASFLLITLRRQLDPRRDDEANAGFDLGALRRLHAQGELTDEQFEAAKATIIDALAGAERPAHPHAEALRPRPTAPIDPAEPDASSRDEPV